MEATQGGVEGRVKSFDDLDQPRDLAKATELMEGADGWQDMMVT